MQAATDLNKDPSMAVVTSMQKRGLAVSELLGRKPEALSESSVRGVTENNTV